MHVELYKRFSVLDQCMLNFTRFLCFGTCVGRMSLSEL